MVAIPLISQTLFLEVTHLSLGVVQRGMSLRLDLVMII